MLAPSAPTSITLLTGKVVSTLAWITAMGSWFQFAFPQEVVGISDIQLFSCHLMTQKHYFVLPVINNGHMKLTFKKMLQLYTKMVIMYESTITEHFFSQSSSKQFFYIWVVMSHCISSYEPKHMFHVLMGYGSLNTEMTDWNCIQSILAYLLLPCCVLLPSASREYDCLISSLGPYSSRINSEREQARRSISYEVYFMKPFFAILIL